MAIPEWMNEIIKSNKNPDIASTLISRKLGLVAQGETVIVPNGMKFTFVPGKGIGVFDIKKGIVEFFDTGNEAKTIGSCQSRPTNPSMKQWR